MVAGEQPVGTDRAADNQNAFFPGGEADPGWPFVRGPQYDGHSPEKHLADSWPQDGPPVLWSRPLGQGYSSFIAWDHRVATQYQTLAGQYVVCMDADTGKTIWEHRYAWPYEPASVYPGPRSTPTYSGGRVYFATPRAQIGCLAADDGQLMWQVDLQRRYGGKGADFGYSCAPLVIDEMVLMPVGGAGCAMVALDATDGSPVWKSGDDAASYTPAQPISFAGRKLVLGYLQNALVCFDRTDGRIVWREVLSHGYAEHAAWPIYREPNLWISQPFQAGSQLFELTGRSGQSLRLVWASRLMSNDIFSSVLVDGAICGFDLREAQAKAHRPSRGQFRSIRMSDGRPLWAVESPPIHQPHGTARGQIGHCTVTVADGKLILLTDTGELILARATSKQYEELARARILGGQLCWTRPALHRGRLFARNASRAVCVYLGMPALLAPAISARALTTADIPQSAYFDLAALVIGVEPEYAFDRPSNRWLIEWFLISWLGILGGSAVVGMSLACLLPPDRRGAAAIRLFLVFAFVLGAIGTTLLSRCRDDFVFTWPVCLFVAFHVVIRGTYRAQNGAKSRANLFRNILVLSFFVAVCGIYFLLCRRLSLVFEWTFLCGFLGAVPFLMLAQVGNARRHLVIIWQMVTISLAFAAFYWSSVLVLVWKTVVG